MGDAAVDKAGTVCALPDFGAAADRPRRKSVPDSAQPGASNGADPTLRLCNGSVSRK